VCDTEFGEIKMSDLDYNEEELDNNLGNDESENDSKNWRRKLEADAKEGKRASREAEIAKQEAAQAKRELALIKAGIDLESGTGKLFAKAYDGEATPEAIKAAAQEFGLVPTSQTQEVQDDLSAIDRISQASAGATGTIAPSALDEIRNAANPADVIKILQANGITISNEQPGGWFPI
jgi:hypothetical protein